MFKLVAIYKTPEDITAFENHYNEIHMPITKKIPHLKEVRMNKIFGAPMGKSPYYLMAELCFASKEDFKNGMSTEEAMASGKDAMTFTNGNVEIFFVEESTEAL